METITQEHINFLMENPRRNLIVNGKDVGNKINKYVDSGTYINGYNVYITKNKNDKKFIQLDIITSCHNKIQYEKRIIIDKSTNKLKKVYGFNNREFGIDIPQYISVNTSIKYFMESKDFDNISDYHTLGAKLYKEEEEMTIKWFNNLDIKTQETHQTKSINEFFKLTNEMGIKVNVM
jgi:pSer/pThr/pTyr-binding forkhead associated (FHA) protein